MGNLSISILIFSLKGLRQPSRDIIWRGKSAGQTWTAFFASMGFCDSGQKEVNGVAVTVNIYYSGVDGNAVKFAEEMISSGTVSDIRAEDGNMRYEYFFPMEDKETVLLIDSWKDQHSLDVHHASPMMAKIMELREKYGLHMRVERYVPEEAGIPAADRTFIRE